jgi:hypothetical protein
MKKSLSLRSAFGIACLGLLLTACAKEDAVFPNSLVPATTNDHREERSRDYQKVERPASIHLGLTASAAGEIRTEEGKLMTKKPTTVCLECDPERDGHYIEIGNSDAK